jgi:hypothetical protein
MIPSNENSFPFIQIHLSLISAMQKHGWHLRKNKGYRAKSKIAPVLKQMATHAES